MRKTEILFRLLTERLLTNICYFQQILESWKGKNEEGSWKRGCCPEINGQKADTFLMVGTPKRRSVVPRIQEHIHFWGYCTASAENSGRDNLETQKIKKSTLLPHFHFSMEHYCKFPTLPVKCISVSRIKIKNKNKIKKGDLNVVWQH